MPEADPAVIARRADMAADPAWDDDLKEAGGARSADQDKNRILRPTAFFGGFRAARRG